MCNIRLLIIIIIIIISCHLISCRNIIFQDDGPKYEEGDDCPLENGQLGFCKKLPECPPRLKEIQEGKRTWNSTGRCGFDHLTEIVCCPLRPAEVACELQRGFTGVSAGVQAQQGEFPFMVALGYTTSKTDENPSSITYTCGGSLITFEHVLTAAHCVSNIQDRVPVEVRLGNVDLNNNEGAQRIPISDIVSHPQYRRSMNYNDVAILKLKFTVEISPMVWPICLETKSVAAIDITPNPLLVVIGWGRTTFESEKLSDTLMKSPSLRIVKSEVCNKSFTEFTHRLPRGIIGSMICLADPNTTRMADACPGDSGGPLLLSDESRNSLIGITAIGSFCGTTTPGIYTAIYPFLDWIEKHVWPTLTSAVLPSLMVLP